MQVAPDGAAQQLADTELLCRTIMNCTQSNSSDFSDVLVAFLHFDICYYFSGKYQNKEKPLKRQRRLRLGLQRIRRVHQWGTHGWFWGQNGGFEPKFMFCIAFEKNLIIE